MRFVWVLSIKHVSFGSLLALFWAVKVVIFLIYINQTYLIKHFAHLPYTRYDASDAKSGIWKKNLERHTDSKSLRYLKLIMNSGNTFHCDKVHAFFIARTQCLNFLLLSFSTESLHFFPRRHPAQTFSFSLRYIFSYKSFKEHSSLTEYAKACHLPLNSSLIRDN